MSTTPVLEVFTQDTETGINRARAEGAAARLVSPLRRVYVFGGADNLFPYFTTFALAVTNVDAMTPAPSPSEPVSILTLSNLDGTPVGFSGDEDVYELQARGIFVESLYKGYIGVPVVTTVPTTLSEGTQVIYAVGANVRLYIGNKEGNAVWLGKEATATEIRDNLESLSGYERLPSGSVKDVEAGLGVRKYVVGVDGDTASTVAIDSTSGVFWDHTGDLSLLPTPAYSPRLGLYAITRSGTTDSCILTSPDGKVWTPRATPTETKSGTSVIWVEDLGLFVAIAGFSGSVDIIVSSDGVAWTQVLNNPSITIAGVEWSPELGILIVGGGATNPIGNTNISTDGYNWTSIGEAAVSGAPVWVDGVSAFIRTGINNSYISTNGTSWTLITKPAGDMRRVLWVPKLNKLFALVGNTTVAVSTDGGYTFTSVLTTSLSTATQILIWSDELEILVVSGGLGTTRLYVTRDGVTWTQPTTAGSPYHQMFWARELGMFVAGAGSSSLALTKISTSVDGITWTDINLSDYRYAYWLPEAGRVVRVTSMSSWKTGKSIIESIVEPIAQTVKPYLSTLFRISAMWVDGVLVEYDINPTTDDHGIANASVFSPGEGNIIIEFNDLPVNTFVRGATLPLDLGGDEGGLTQKIALAVVGDILSIYVNDNVGTPLAAIPPGWFEIISPSA